MLESGPPRYALRSVLLPIIPCQLIEPLGITLIFVIAAVPALIQGDPRQVLGILPFLSALAIAAQRLTSHLQQLFHSLTELRDVWYCCPNSEEWVLKGVHLTIPMGSRIALVGNTGSGKSTVAHPLLGLLKPELGQLEFDGSLLSREELPAWQFSCAQVPQIIQLLDASVRDNVAFGIDEQQIDDDLVWEALESAQLGEYVSELPYGLLTPVGENGHQLSGDQRQRLARARAFYRHASFLVLDEATSALDNRTESEVINALEVVGRRCTMVMIAHRLSTISRCDRIYEFDKGEVKAFGTFAELQERSCSFRELAQLERLSSRDGMLLQE